jgi:uncharacterized membrane protein
MIKKIKSLLIVATTMTTLFMPGAAGMALAAGCDGIQNSINSGANAALQGQSDTCTVTTTNTSSQTLATLAHTVVNLFSLIVGIVAVIMIIYGGFRYITSGGESGAVGNAKNTLIYAIVGLIIVALAQLIVHFILNAIVNNSVSTG